MPTKRGARALQVSESQESQESLNDQMSRTRLDSGASVGSGALPASFSSTAINESPSPFKITVCLFNDIKNDETFAPQNCMFAYTDGNDAEVKKRLKSIKKTATEQGIAFDIITVDAVSRMPPTVVGGLTPRFIFKSFKDNVNGWGVKKKKQRLKSRSDSF